GRVHLDWNPAWWPGIDDPHLPSGSAAPRHGDRRAALQLRGAVGHERDRWWIALRRVDHRRWRRQPPAKSDRARGRALPGPARRPARSEAGWVMRDPACQRSRTVTFTVCGLPDVAPEASVTCTSKLARSDAEPSCRNTTLSASRS